MSIIERIENSAGYLIGAWLTKDPDGEAPLKFADQLALVLFNGALCRMMYRYYTMGVKHERRRRKREMSRRYQRSGGRP